jgi:2',3'-cyclic-nucleotide 2'-phosphodiesterase (5'-nucleotidase family)
VTSIAVNGQPLKDTGTYTLATNSYLATGGDGYTMFLEAPYLTDAENAQIGSVIVMNAIASVGTIAPEVDGRIKRLDE